MIWFFHVDRGMLTGHGRAADFQHHLRLSHLPSLPRPVSGTFLPTSASRTICTWCAGRASCDLRAMRTGAARHYQARESVPRQGRHDNEEPCTQILHSCHRSPAAVWLGQTSHGPRRRACLREWMPTLPGPIRIDGKRPSRFNPGHHRRHQATPLWDEHSLDLRHVQSTEARHATRALRREDSLPSTLGRESAQPYAAPPLLGGYAFAGAEAHSAQRRIASALQTPSRRLTNEAVSSWTTPTQKLGPT